jgi:hypothetical protein
MRVLILERVTKKQTSQQDYAHHVEMLGMRTGIPRAFFGETDNKKIVVMRPAV